jgi:hypothetical protein
MTKASANEAVIVGWALVQLVGRDMYVAVYRTVDRILSQAVSDAVWTAMLQTSYEEPTHPGLGLYLEAVA